MSENNENGYSSYEGKYYRKSTHKKRRRKSRAPIITAIIISIVIIVGVFAYFLINKSNPIEGTWVYDSYTQYVFEKDGTGCFEVDDVHYEYTYKINGNNLSMDFTEDVVRDCEYTFTIEENTLTLVGGKNTDGGTYQLTKK